MAPDGEGKLGIEVPQLHIPYSFSKKVLNVYNVILENFTISQASLLNLQSISRNLWHTSRQLCGLFLNHWKRNFEALFLGVEEE